MKCSVRSKLRPDQLVHTSLYTHTHSQALFPALAEWERTNGISLNAYLTKCVVVATTTLALYGLPLVLCSPRRERKKRVRDKKKVVMLIQA